MNTSLVADTDSPGQSIPAVTVPAGAQPGPYRVGGTDLQIPQPEGEQPKAAQREGVGASRVNP